ncbi:NF-kappa-B inhibitor delta-like [Sinocyclocheilus grahami]|uniref:NF-kappa-B inhibitor delta-like n=1 Tax=Sinocyclocheilus grahami TaxID=75366 RepID=UPI0007AC5EE7|nr:PREDICTED: NF-kappa-B inhibitor delta-like [Sinocyclocheilus grahami]
MHFQKSQKEKACYPLPTVKKLLEQKRKRETSSAPPSCSTASYTAGGAASVPVLASVQSPTAGASASYTDMGAVRYDRWEVPSIHQAHSSLQQCSPFTFMSSSSITPNFTQTGQMLATGYINGSADYHIIRCFTRGVLKVFILHIYTAKGLREYAFAAAEKLRELGKLDSKEHKGKTALLVAVTASQPDIVQDLLSLGADISICDVNGQTALHLAATYGFPRVMQVILFAGLRVDLEARNFEGLTPLHCAVISHCATMKAINASSSSSTWLADGSLQTQAEDKLMCLRLLINAGASVLSQEIKSNKTVLHLAVKEGNIQLVRFLLSLQLSNMQAFINMKAHGHTALHMAAGLHGSPFQEELIRLLLSRGADPSIRNLENDQPAHLLQSGDTGEKLKLILKKKSASSRRRFTSLQDQE